MNETKSKKVVRRSVVIALGIVCIILIACLGGTMAYYTLTMDDKDNAIASKNSQIASLNSEVLQLNTNATNLQNQIDTLRSNVTSLQNQVSNLTDALNLSRSTIVPIAQARKIWYYGILRIVPPLELTMLDENAPYAGYVSVEAALIQSNGTISIDVEGSSDFNHLYTHSIDLGSSGTAIFPVPPSNMSIYFYDLQLRSPVSSEIANVTITYYY
jgi:cell division protein FtsB